MTKWYRRTVIHLTIIGLVLVACSPSSSSAPSPEPGPAPAPQPEPAPAPDPAPTGGQPVVLRRDAACPVEGDFEGQFQSSEQMPAFLECVIPGIEQWIDSIYQAMPEVQGYYFVPTGVSGTDATGCPYDDSVLLYCIGQEAVYLGEAFVWLLYSQFGDAAPVIVVAHEVTHHFQNMVRMPAIATANASIPYENQADCGSGAFMSYAYRQGWMNVEDDIVDLAGALQAAGQAEGVNRSHGTSEERVSAFDLAYLSDLDIPLYACVDYVPDIAIIAP